MIVVFYDYFLWARRDIATYFGSAARTFGNAPARTPCPLAQSPAASAQRTTRGRPEMPRNAHPTAWTYKYGAKFYFLFILQFLWWTVLTASDSVIWNIFLRPFWNAFKIMRVWFCRLMINAWLGIGTGLPNAIFCIFRQLDKFLCAYFFSR